jgi:23S rRNA pseudouridine2605 synthase
MKERLQKLLAQANIGSRRASEDLISAGRVRVNGKAAQLGDKADPATDVIEVDGTRLKFDAQAHKYIMLNKPKQVLSTDKPHRTDKRDTIMDLIGLKEHLFSIGRLDADSEGLVVMTNDGDMAQKLSHPRYRHTKTYKVEVHGLPTAETLDKWRQGVFLEDGRTAPCFVEITHGSVRGSTLRVIMTEGKKRQIRRVASLLGHPVSRLIRTHIGMLALGALEVGRWRELTQKEIMLLRTSAPEGKALRATPRRIAPAPDAEAEEAPHVPRARRSASDDEPRERRRSPLSQMFRKDDTSEKRRTPRTRTNEPADETGERRRTPRSRVSDSAADASETRRAPRRAAQADDSQPKRRTTRSRTGDSSDDTQEKRRTPRTRPSDTDGASDKRRTPRTRPSSTSDDAPPKRRITRSPVSDASDDAPTPRRAPRTRTSDTSDDAPDSRRISRTPSGKKSGTPGAKRRVSRPAGVKRNPTDRKPRRKKDNPR